jgi:pimeloyl-ACP methyl ester carboxylesterase
VTAAGTPKPHGGLPDEAELRARHSLPASTFVEVDGVELHYVDEGRGPAILLLHGSYASLRQWDDWSAGLKSRYRVVRFDWPAYGLSGADPAGDYGCERKIALLLAFAGHLEINRFLLVGTSSAGVPAAALAALYPERVTGLILNNVAVGPLQHDHPLTPELTHEIEQDALHPGWHSLSFWREVLRMHYANPDRVKPETVAHWTDFNNRSFSPELTPDGANAEAEFCRTPADLARIEIPTLLLWSDRDLEVPVEREGRAAFDLLACIDKELVIVPDCGHMAPDECGANSLTCAVPFITRILDYERAN